MTSKWALERRINELERTLNETREYLIETRWSLIETRKQVTLLMRTMQLDR